MNRPGRGWRLTVSAAIAAALVTVAAAWQAAQTPTYPVVGLRLPGYGLVAQVPQAQAYRVLSGQISARGQITDGPGPFDCPLLPGAPQPGPGVAAVCVIPDNVQAFDGLAGL